MTDERFPKLRYGYSLLDLGYAVRSSYVRELVPLLSAILERHGPLPLKGLQYFLRRDENLRLEEVDIVQGILRSGAGQLAFDEARLEVGNETREYYRTVAQAAVGDEPRLPLPPHGTDYVTGYYRLYSLLEAARADPSLLQTPPRVLSQLGLL